jgi:hypothetical protein
LQRKSEKLPYTKAEVNKILDAVIHPWMKDYPWLNLVDGLLHTLNERNPKSSLRKFLRYNLKPLIDGLQQELRREIERNARENLRE